MKNGKSSIELSQLHSLEGLRFLSSLGIVAFHYIPYATPLGPLDNLHICVDLFFVISGIVIAQSYATTINARALYLDFIKRRLARIYPLHLATLAFYVVVGLAVVFLGLKVADPTKYNFAMLLPNLLLVHAWLPHDVISFNYVSWSISAEMFVYLLFPALAFIAARDLKAGLAIFAALLVAAMFISETFLDEPLTDLDWNFGVLRAVPSFFLGVWLSLYRDRLMKMLDPRRARLLCHLAMAGAVAAMLLDANPYVILAAIYLVVVGAFFADLGGRRTLVSWAPLARRGKLTYSIYMLHTLVATVFLSFLAPRLIGTSDTAEWISIALAFAITYCAAIVSFRFFEMPLRNRINAIRLPARRPAPPEPPSTDALTPP